MQVLSKVILLFIFSFITLFANTYTWTGKWHASWHSGAFVLQLEEHGTDINGTFEPGHGRLSGKIYGNQVKASTTTESGQMRHLTLTMGESGKSFFGRNSIDEWISGVRVGELVSMGIPDWSNRVVQVDGETGVRQVPSPVFPIRFRKLS